MVRDGLMGNAHALDGRHMTGGAIVLFLLFPADAWSQATAGLSMARQTATAEEGRPLLGCRENVGVVAGDAAHFSVTLLKAPAQVHLLHVTELAAIGPLRPPHEGGPEKLEGEAWAEIKGLPAAPQNP